MAMKTHKIFVIFYEETQSNGEKKWKEHSRTSDKSRSMKTLGDLQRAGVNAYPETRYF